MKYRKTGMEVMDFSRYLSERGTKGKVIGTSYKCLQ